MSADASDASDSTVTTPTQSVRMTTDSDNSRNVYDAWAKTYQTDTEAWGYDMPQQVAALLAQQMLIDTTAAPKTLKILDAGCGSGLSGLALRQAGFRAPLCTLIGADVSPKMLEIARDRTLMCYNELVVLDLNATPFASTATSHTGNSGTIHNALDASHRGTVLCLPIKPACRYDSCSK